MQNLTYLLIVNPQSGSGVYKKELKQVQSYFSKHKMQLSIRMTEYQGHAQELAREACKTDVDVIIGAGGDGTINEVINGMAHSDKALAILPWGTGNVFAKEMNISRSTKTACQIIRKGMRVKVDLGKENDRYFLLMCSAGFDAYSVRKVERFQLKRVFGRLTYLFASIQALIRYQYPRIKIRLADGTEDEGGFVLVSNTSRYAIYFTVSPKANPMDGELDVYIFRESGGWSIIKLFTRLIIFTLRRKPKGEKTQFFKKEASYKTTSLDIWSDGETPTQIDGDISSDLPVRITIEAGVLNVILPKKIAKKHLKRAKKYSKKKK